MRPFPSSAETACCNQPISPVPVRFLISEARMRQSMTRKPRKNRISGIHHDRHFKPLDASLIVAADTASRKFASVLRLISRICVFGMAGEAGVIATRRTLRPGFERISSKVTGPDRQFPQKNGGLMRRALLRCNTLRLLTNLRSCFI